MTNKEALRKFLKKINYSNYQRARELAFKIPPENLNCEALIEFQKGELFQINKKYIKI